MVMSGANCSMMPDVVKVILQDFARLFRSEITFGVGWQRVAWSDSDRSAGFWMSGQAAASRVCSCIVPIGLGQLGVQTNYLWQTMIAFRLSWLTCEVPGWVQRNLNGWGNQTGKMP